MNSMCLWMSAPEVTLFTDIPYLLLNSRLRKRRWYRFHIFPCHIHVWLILLLHQIASSPAECVEQWGFLRVFVSAWQDLVICCLSGSRLGSDHARLQESSLNSTVIAFYYDTCMRACSSVHYQAFKGRRFTNSLAWSGMIDCRLLVRQEAVSVTTQYTSVNDVI